MKTEYDIIIIGGGLVGLSFALSLENQDCSIALIDAKPQKPFDKTQSRPLSLNASSQCIFANLKIWDALATSAAPIKTVQVSERNRFGVVNLRASDVGADALGYVTDIADLANTLFGRTKAQHNLDLLQPATVENVITDGDEAHLNVKLNNSVHTLKSKLLIAADGANSRIASTMHFTREKHDYAQTAITSTLNCTSAPCHTAFERFTDNGTIALLPLGKNKYGLVWCAQTETAKALLALDDSVFLKKLQTHLGYRAGYFEEVAKRNALPLSYSHVRERYKKNVIILGNASLTIHPVAAQGFNLALHDAITLSDMLAPHMQDKARWVRESFLKEVDEALGEHQKTVMQFSNKLVDLYHNTHPLCGVARSLALNFVSLSQHSRQIISKFGMGQLAKRTFRARTVA